MLASDGAVADKFGQSVAISGDTIVVGAYQDDSPLSNGGWTLQQKLTASDGASFDRFGWSVAVSNDVVAVGAREDDTTVGPDAGSAYLFTRSGTIWTEQENNA